MPVGKISSVWRPDLKGIKYRVSIPVTCFDIQSEFVCACVVQHHHRLWKQSCIVCPVCCMLALADSPRPDCCPQLKQTLIEIMNPTHSCSSPCARARLQLLPGVLEHLLEPRSLKAPARSLRATAWAQIGAWSVSTPAYCQEESLKAAAAIASLLLLFESKSWGLVCTPACWCSPPSPRRTRSSSTASTHSKPSRRAATPPKQPRRPKRRSAQQRTVVRRAAVMRMQATWMRMRRMPLWTRRRRWVQREGCKQLSGVEVLSCRVMCVQACGEESLGREDMAPYPSCPAQAVAVHCAYKQHQPMMFSTWIFALSNRYEHTFYHQDMRLVFHEMCRCHMQGPMYFKSFVCTCI